MARSLTEAAPAQVGDSVERVVAGWAASRPDLDVSPIAVIARIFRLSAELQPKLDAVLGRYGVRSADFAVLATLIRLGDPQVSQSRLGRELNLSAGTISFRIDRVERDGLVIRQPAPDDQRQTLVGLTEKGRRVFDACVGDHLTNSTDLLGGLEEDEREALATLLGKLLASLEDPGPDELLAARAGLVVASAATALRLRREVGLPATPGILVRHVAPGGPAAAAGLRPGDLLTAADSRTLRTAADLRAALSSRAGGTCVLDFLRGADTLQCQMSTSAAAGNGARARALTEPRG